MMPKRICSAIWCAALAVAIGRGTNWEATSAMLHGRELSFQKLDIRRISAYNAARRALSSGGGKDVATATSAGEIPALRLSDKDDPRVVEEAATEDYSLHVVPRTWRMDRGKLTMAWYAVMTAFFYMYFAAFIALAYGTVNALIGIVLTVIAYSLVNTVITRVASTSGLTVALFSRSMFGFVGASVATLIFAATATYYLVFEGSVVAVAAQTFFGGP